ncbi:glycoside hydrolase family 73 protein, partial [Weissella confusa]|uniref:glycoside hydrolase family 73 protein n=1 Tax=Weissella confusa TaxID=1583 RepID=UPI002A749735
MTNNTKIVSLALLAATSSFGLITTNAKADTVSDFKSKMATPVRNAANRYNVWPSVMMAQATLESGWGQSTLSKEANNYFGIKGTYNGQYVNMNTAEYDSEGHLYYVVAQFKKYPSPEESMNDNGNLIRNGLSWNHAYYSGSWRENAATYQQAAQALVGKYATDPVYGNKLVNLIQQYGFHELVDETIKPAKYAVGQKVQLTNGALNAADGASIKDMQNWIG